MKYINVKSPQWANVQKTAIDCVVEFEGLGIVPFTANPNDITEHGPAIFSACLNGDFGPIADYVGPTEPELPEISSDMNRKLAEQKLMETDWVNQPDVYDPAMAPHLTNRDAFLAYRSQLRMIAINPAPGKINWPKEPQAMWAGAA